MANFLSYSTLGGICFALGLVSVAQAQIFKDEAVWTEADVPPPPAFNLGKLVTFDVPTSPGLVFGVDPAAIRISNADSVVRYVVVATSTSGVRNVMYEGLRCATGEFKTYARYSPDGQWKPATGSEWRSVFGNMPSKHALRFAQAGACDGAAPASTVDLIVSKLKYPARTSN